MSVAIVTGSAGLVGSAAVRMLAEQQFTVVGIDNDLRQFFFGPAASTKPVQLALERAVPNYRHYAIDIRDRGALEEVFRRYEANIELIVHAAAQPSHDWAAADPQTDFAVNAGATLGLLELTRRNCPDASFLFMSTNKVYGDRPNRLPLVEQATRFELDAEHPCAAHGIDESMSIDQSLHSLFGASKVAADVLVQEYGRYYQLKTACFRGGCITGPAHAGAQQHGFLSHLARCCAQRAPYTIFGHQGKQVRDNLHADDLARMFWSFHQRPQAGAVYNVGGGRRSNCSVREAIAICEELSGRPMTVNYVDQPRVGDHVWWISDTRRFERDYPQWRPRYGLVEIIAEIHAAHSDRR